MKTHTSVKLSNEVQALARDIKLTKGKLGLPVTAVIRFLAHIDPQSKETKRRRAQELLALAIRIHREAAGHSSQVVAQLFFVVGLVLGDLARAEDMFAKAGLANASQKLTGMAGFEAGSFEPRDPDKKTGFVNFLSKKNG